MEATAHVCHAHGCGERPAGTLTLCPAHQRIVNAFTYWLIDVLPCDFGTPSRDTRPV